MKNRILIIEASPLERHVFSGAFAREYDLSFARHAKEALKSLPALRPQAMVLNLRVPDIKSAWDYAELKVQASQEVPAIVIAGNNNLEMERAFRQIGIFYYLAGPCEMRELADVLKSAFAVPLKWAVNG